MGEPEQLIRAFRNDYNPCIAVTVDMIATGTDVKPIEALIFLRDVWSEGLRASRQRFRTSQRIAAVRTMRCTHAASG